MLSGEPGHLTFCKLTGGNRDFFTQFGTFYMSKQIFPDDGIAQRLPRGGRLQQSLFDQCFGFPDPSGGKHLFRADPDPFTQFLPVPYEKELFVPTT